MLKIKRPIRIWKVVLAITILIIAITAVALAVLHSKKVKRENQKECYRRQNLAFLLTENGEYDLMDKGAREYLPYDKCSLVPKLYSWVLCYNYETDSHLSLQDIEDYLSKEFKEDGSRVIYTDYKEIQKYVDFINRCKERKYNPLDDFDVRVLNELEKIQGHKLQYTYDVYQNSTLHTIEEVAKKIYDENYVMQLEDEE